MSQDVELPPEMQEVLDALSEQPAATREMFRYALVLMMIDDEKARVLDTQEEDGQTVLTVRTTAGDEFRIVRPAMSEETEMILLESIRAIVAEDQDTSSV